MGLYRIMVSGAQEYWETLDIEADSVQEARGKALHVAQTQGSAEWDNFTGVRDIVIEGVEILEETISKSSDLAWVEDITKKTGEAD